MATAQTILNRVLRKFVDTDQTVLDDNTELLDYFNDALDEISREIAKWRSREFGRKSTTASYTSPAYSAALPSDYLVYAISSQGYPKVYNVTDDYAVMYEASEDDITLWEDETATDIGTPNQFYTVGTSLYIHHRPSVDTTVKIFYFPLEQITALTDTVPWSGFFDRAVEAYVLMKCRERDEQVHLLPTAAGDYQRKLGQAKARIYQGTGFKMTPGVGYGFGNATVRTPRLRTRVTRGY